MARGWFGVRREVILKPNETLSEAQKEGLSHELTPLTAQGFMRDISSEAGYESLYADVFNHVVPCDRLSIFRGVNENTPVAFIAAGIKSFGILRVYHLEGIIVSPVLHGNGFSQRILSRELITCNAQILAFHTQSKLMEKLGAKVSEPDIDLAREIAGSIGTNNLIDLPTGPIDGGRYGGQSLYGDIGRFDSVAIKNPGFDYLNGDAIVFAGRVKK